ncbi:MAG: cell surface protein [Planctomycetota bacterium]|nr:MAG: cell surface protein [Planctomycetota bacterium]
MDRVRTVSGEGAVAFRGFGVPMTDLRFLWMDRTRRGGGGRAASFVGWCAAWAIVLVATGPLRFSPGAEPVGSNAFGPRLPQALAISDDGKRLYVGCAGTGELLLVDWVHGKVVRRAALPGPAAGVLVHPANDEVIVLIEAAQGEVCTFDAQTLTPTGSMRVGHTPVDAVFGKDGENLYVCNRFDNTLSVIDWKTRRVMKTISVGREPIAVDRTPDGKSLVIAHHLPDVRTDRPSEIEVCATVRVVDTTTFSQRVIPLWHGAHGARDVQVLPDGRYAVVSHLFGNFESMPFRVDNGWINANVVAVVDLEKDKVYATIGLDEYYEGAAVPWGIALADDGNLVCVAASGTHELLFMKRDELLGEYAYRTMQPMLAVWPIYLSLGDSLWRHVALPGRGPRAIVARGNFVYVAERYSDTIACVDLSHQEPRVRQIRVGPGVGDDPVLRGEALFHDATICYQHWQSCASCHPDGRMDALNWDLLNDGTGNPKNTKSLLFSHVTPPAMATGVRPTAEAAVRAGLKHILFTDENEQTATLLDAYLRSLRPVPSPALVDGNLSPAARRGRDLFFSAKLRCDRCHAGTYYTDGRKHDVGTAGPFDTEPRFDTPTLIEVWRTAPYLHDGRYRTLGELFREGKHGLKGRELSEAQLDDLIEFVRSL